MMISLVVLTLYARPRYHLWKITHKFFGLALFLGALHVYLIPGYITKNLLLKGYVLLLAILGILAFLYKSVFGKYLIRRYEYLVEDTNRLNDEIMEITFRPKNESLSFEAGQFVFVSFEQKGLSESHPFSISSGPDEDQLKITVKRSGDFTGNLVRNLKKGTVARIEGPYGVFSHTRILKKNQVWIGGGIGITPFVSFAKDLMEKKIQINVTLFYCARNRDEAIYLDFFKNMEAQSSHFAVIPFYSSQHGHIDTEYIRRRVENFPENDFFICAPPRMIKELKDDLMAEGIGQDKIHSEEFSF
jgi:predicted ferric reductase